VGIVRQIGRAACRVVQNDGCVLYFLDMHSRQHTPAKAQPWLKSDLLFLELSLRNGMAVAEVAGFLDRDEDEVREKFRELRRS